MKKTIIIFAFIVFSAIAVNAQKFCYVDIDYILKNVPEYASAQKQLDQISADWQKEIDAKYDEIDKLYKSYQTESIVLPEDMKIKKQDEIVQKEKEAKDLQRKRFSQDGDLHKKRMELVKPIQDKIYNAIKEMAEKESYMVVFDKSSQLNILYGSDKIDKSADILTALGVAVKSK